MEEIHRYTQEPAAAAPSVKLAKSDSWVPLQVPTVSWRVRRVSQLETCGHVVCLEGVRGFFSFALLECLLTCHDVKENDNGGENDNDNDVCNTNDDNGVDVHVHVDVQGLMLMLMFM